MTEFERNWTHAEQEQQARLLYQLKKEIVAKRQAEQAQVKLQRTAQANQELLSSPLPSAATPAETARPRQKRLASH